MPDNTAEIDSLKKCIRDIPDFPKKGIIFKDITPLLQDPHALSLTVDLFAAELRKYDINLIVGVESRGFIFSAVLAYKLGIGFAPVRKQGKLPWHTHQINYVLEYGEAALEIHQDAVERGMKVAILDDLLATGGTAAAATALIEKLGGKVEVIACLIELRFFQAREKLAPLNIFSLIQY